MGFWHTGVMDHISLPSEFHWEYDSRPIIYHCSHCNYNSLIIEDLRQHRFETHPYNRPILYIKGKELGSTPFKITSCLSPSDINIENCTHSSVNGRSLPISELGNTLSKIHLDTVTVELEGLNVSAVFKLRFEIADEEDLAAVDIKFLEVARGRRLDMRAIEQFIHASKPYTSAIGYCDGICEYFYGVLAKERVSDSTLPYDSYREKFNRAADELKDFDRPLARVISALIAFHFNHFEETQKFSGPLRVGIAASRFKNWLTVDIDFEKTEFKNIHNNLEGLVTDIDSENFIRWGVSTNKELILHKEEIKSLLYKEISDFDRVKAYIILGRIALEQQDTKEALHYAREFRNSPTMGVWAEHIIEACKNIG